MSISRESYFMRLITDIHKSISHKHMSISQYISLFLSQAQVPHVSKSTHLSKNTSEQSTDMFEPENLNSKADASEQMTDLCRKNAETCLNPKT